MYEFVVICLLVFITGACIGSFLNVVALRALSEESIVFPSSKCPSCETPIKWYDNIPIISYFLFLHGKCRSCGCKISIQYPIVEALTAIFFLAMLFTYGISVKSLLMIILFCISIVISITDIKEHTAITPHLWILIITAFITSLYWYGIDKWYYSVIGSIFAFLFIEVLSKLGYLFYLFIIGEFNKEKLKDFFFSFFNKKQKMLKDFFFSIFNRKQKKLKDFFVSFFSRKQKELKDFFFSFFNKKQKNSEDEEDLKVEDYIEQEKKLVGDGDRDIAIAIGALLGGWLWFFISFCVSLIVWFIPQFFVMLFKQKEYKKIVFSLLAFLTVSFLYCYLFYSMTLNIIWIQYLFIMAMCVIGLFTVINMRKSKPDISSYEIIPLGPPLLIGMFITFFFRDYILKFIKFYLF